MVKNQPYKDLKVGYFKLETFGAVDGPGIRMVVFLQGCKYRCIYCHNPESWSMNTQEQISVNEILDKFNANKEFYKNGGITVSGGEPLMHKEFCYELSKACNIKNINLAFDTSGLTFEKSNLAWFKKIIKFKPFWIVDIKHIDEKMHKVITGFENLNELNLIKFLEANKQPYWVRQVLVPNYNNDKKTLLKLKSFLKKLKYMKKFEFLPYHELALDKYRKLNIDYALQFKTRVPTKEEIIDAYKIIS